MQASQRTVAYDLSTGAVYKEEKTLLVTRESELGHAQESNIVGIYPDYFFQSVDGFGCALTESACYLLAQMDAETRRHALKCWFGPDGVNARFVRIHVDSCDYSLSEYQSVADPIADPQLKTFNIDRDRQYILPVMREAMELCGGNISVLLSPWSPPAQWKTAPVLSENDLAVYGHLGASMDFSKPGRCFGGRLKPEYYSSWAKYLVKFVQAYLSEGIPVTMLSVQNEAFAATPWDSCIWSGKQEKEFLRDYLYPEMKAAGISETVGLYVWDHNKERMIEHIDEIMDRDTLDIVEGFAFHWYSGDHFDVLQMLEQKYPGKILMHSESCGLHMPGKPSAFEVSEEDISQMPAETQIYFRKKSHFVDYEDAVQYAHDILGDLNHGMCRWIDWNLIVDRAGGPRHVPGGFAAPIVAEEDGSYTKTVSYEYILEIAKTIQQGAVRIGSIAYSTQVEITAVRNKDGSIGIVLLNRQKSVNVFVRLNGYIIDAYLPQNSLNSITIRNWIKAVTVKLLKKTTSSHLRIGWIINIFLFITMTGIIVTGIMISKTLPINVGKWFGAKRWHYFLAAVSIILMGIHLGLHWPFIKEIASKGSFSSKKLSLVINVLLLVIVLGWGSYSLFTGSFARWIAGPFSNASYQRPENIGEYKGEGENNGERIPPDGITESQKTYQEGSQIEGKNRGEGKNSGMKPGENYSMAQSINIVNILTVIATYGSEMIVFTVLILGHRKRPR